MSSRKDNAALVSLLQNRENNEEDEDKIDHHPLIRKGSNASTSLKKYNQICKNNKENQKLKCIDQQNLKLLNSADENEIFGRDNTDERASLRRKTGMTVIAPAINNGTIPSTSKKGENFTKSIQAYFDRHRGKGRRSISKTNILDENSDENSMDFKKHKPWYRKLLVSKRVRSIARQLIEDWIFLALLGVIMALLSFGMDWAIEFLQTEHAELMKVIDQKMTGDSATNFVQYLLWVFYAIILVTCSALFSFYIAPQAIGSGIPEMKTILRGVILKEYLTFRTLISKIVGLTLSLGSGLPIGKEGPFVHVASIVANLLSHLVNSFHGPYANESRSSEMLAAGCAVGVACTFSAPVGGVLFSIEVTSVYFAVRNYWRGFFAATCSATIFRLLRVINKQALTVVAFYQTSFPREAFIPSELPIFALIGLICGLLSAAFILLQRRMVLFLRRNKFAKNVFQKYWLIYPVVISGFVSSLTFHEGFGRFIGGHQKFSKAAVNFFDNCTFTETNNASERYCSDSIIHNWTDNGSLSPFLTLSVFTVVFYFLIALASTVPIPSGIFGPSFIVGGALGRLVGELVAVLWKDREFEVYPGVYAVVGAAAFCGGVTHTVSVAVIVFELTGQLMYILPVMIAVLIANAVSSYLQPSIYDSIIRIKHLPYLPDIPHSSSNFHGICVEQFMTSNVKYLSKTSTFSELENLLSKMPKLKAFPIVEDNRNPVLIGSCSRAILLQALDKHVGHAARQTEAVRRIKEAIADIDRRFKIVDRQRNSISEGATAMAKRPSIFECLKIDEENNEPSDSGVTPPNIIIQTIAPTPTDNLKTFDFSNRRTQSTTNPEPSSDKEEEGQRRRAQSSITPNRFTVIPVNESKSPNVPGLRPGGRRGGLSVENILERGSVSEGEEGHRKGSNDTVTTSTTTSSIGKLSNRLSTSSFLSSLKNGIKRERPRSFHAESQSSTVGGNGSNTDMYHTIGDVFRSVLTFGKSRNHGSDEYDLSGDERKLWELERLSQQINFDDINVDPAPFQLVEKSSLFKVHSLFSLLGLNRAYVTKCGRLVGVVALRDLRIAIEKVQDGTLFINSGSIYDAPPKRSSELLFEGEHLMGRSASDEQDEDDAENDKLTRRPIVISRTGSQLGDKKYADLAAELAKSQEEPIQDPNHLSVNQPRLNAISDPCIVLNANEMPELEKSRPSGSSAVPEVQKPKFQVSPCPSIRINSNPSSPTTSIKSNNEASNIDSNKKRKKSRHVQICIPPTPDYKKTDRPAFDFPSSSDER